LKASTPDRKLQERLLLAREVPDDRLVLEDGVLLAALTGSRALNAAQLAALQASPLTLKRFRHLAMERRRISRSTLAWRGSAGMLRAAATAVELDSLTTDDGCWSLHFVPAAGGGWQVILKLEASAAFAPQLMREAPLLRVLDGQGAVVLQGRLDADGECERAWPFDAEPSRHFQQRGAGFSIEPAGR
jgi:hypothetical protein